MRRTLVAAATLAAVLFTTAAADPLRLTGAARYAAYVNGKNGGTVRSFGVTGSARTSTGRYYVDFSNVLYYCLFTASLTSDEGGQVSVKFDDATPSRLLVRTFSKAGVRSDRTFSVMADCPPSEYNIVY